MDYLTFQKENVLFVQAYNGVETWTKISTYGNDQTTLEPSSEWSSEGASKQGVTSSCRQQIANIRHYS